MATPQRSFVNFPPEGDQGFVGISVEGMDEVRNYAPRYREVAMSEYTAAINAAVNLAYRTLIPLMPEDLGGALQSLHPKYATGASLFGEGGLEGSIGSELPRMPALEFGRKPGTFPPSAPLEDWAQRNLGVSGLGFVLARAIYQRGSPKFAPGPDGGWKMFQKTYELIEGEVDAIFSSAVDRVLEQM